MLLRNLKSRVPEGIFPDMLPVLILLMKDPMCPNVPISDATQK